MCQDEQHTLPLSLLKKGSKTQSDRFSYKVDLSCKRSVLLVFWHRQCLVQSIVWPTPLTTHPKLTHPAARFLCNRWATCLNLRGLVQGCHIDWYSGTVAYFYEHADRYIVKLAVVLWLSSRVVVKSYVFTTVFVLSLFAIYCGNIYDCHVGRVWTGWPIYTIRASTESWRMRWVSERPFRALRFWRTWLRWGNAWCASVFISFGECWSRCGFEPFYCVLVDIMEWL